MVILVGSFSIITSLVMLVMEKTRDIAILMSMGATARDVRRIFMLQGAIIGAVGTSIGYVLGIILALLLKKYQFIELPPDVYMMDTLPVIIEPLDLAVIGAVSMLMCYLATIYPARKASGLVPAEALRYE
jgi:lipoprotein-releasing system permease protein